MKFHWRTITLKQNDMTGLGKLRLNEQYYVYNWKCIYYINFQCMFFVPNNPTVSEICSVIVIPEPPLSAVQKFKET